MSSKHIGCWPNRVTEGFITYGEAMNYNGFYLSPADHQIPTFASVQVRVFNYPDDTEEIARRLTAAWNASVGKSTADLESEAERRLSEELESNQAEGK